jgi:hypothetical protein
MQLWMNFVAVSSGAIAWHQPVRSGWNLKIFLYVICVKNDAIQYRWGNQNEKQKFTSGKWGVHNESNDNYLCCIVLLVANSVG